MSKRATVIIPTFDHGPLIEYALKSVCQQTLQDIEIFVIGDGAPDITHEIMAKWMAKDPRIQYFSFPKDVSKGEIYRHQVITQHAQGKIICYLSDDDLWLPNHLEVMEQLLSDADFAHTLPLCCLEDGGWEVPTVDLALAYSRAFILNIDNRIPLSFSGHTRAMYDRLPHGWRTTPNGTPTDLYMYRQILAIPTMNAKSGFHATAMHFPSPCRSDWTLSERLAELSKYSEIIVSDSALCAWKDEQLQVASRKLAHMEQTKWWSLRAKLLRYFPMLRFVLAKS